MAMPEFCEQHGNIKATCYICHPREKVVAIIPGIICPVYANKEVPDKICTDPGCIMFDTKTYQCTGCGWEFTNHKSNNPHWVICTCGNSELRKGTHHEKCLQCSSKRYKCASCRNVRARCTCPSKPKNK